MVKFIANDGEVYEATHYFHEKDSIGWRPLADVGAPLHFPRMLGTFAPDINLRWRSEEDDGWREGPCPHSARFYVRRPGGRDVIVTATGEKDA